MNNFEVTLFPHNCKCNSKLQTKRTTAGYFLYHYIREKMWLKFPCVDKVRDKVKVIKQHVQSTVKGKTWSDSLWQITIEFNES